MAAAATGPPERENWERDERCQQLVELAPDGILVHDGERIILGNAAVARLAGAASPHELVDLPIDTFLHPPYLKAVQAKLTDTLSSGELVPPVRDIFRRLDGSEVAVEVRAVAFMDHGRPAAHLVIRDLTERLAVEQAAREMAERLQQAQRMESVGALAGGVAHEVNNMMSVVLGFGDFLLQDVRLPPDCLADVREIMKAADRAATVTRQLLAFSRRAVHRPQVVDLAAAVHAAEPVLRRLLGETLQLDVVTTDAPLVCVDPGQLEQVIINLALNSRDAMPEGGTLTLTTGQAELPAGVAAADGSVIPAGHYATLLVRDNGTGMDAATQARIFEPFFTTKPVGQGTGLGLAAAHGIIDQHHGYLTLASAPGQGAAFTMYLPIHIVVDLGEPGGEPALPIADAAHASATVLVVDDEVGVRTVVSRSLEQGGYRVLKAHDGGHALELIARLGPPQLLLTDLTMPGIGGAELARRLRERWPALPVIFMSGYSEEELVRQGAIGSGGELLQKPFSPAGVLACVTATLSRAGVPGQSGG